MRRKRYIANMPLEQALETYFQRLDLRPRWETLSLSEALGRVLKGPVVARLSSPPFPCAAMDGIAVAAADTHGAQEHAPLVLEEGLTFVYVNTGNPMPEGKDAVIMIEDVVTLDHGALEIRQAAHPWQHVRAVGEDLIAGDMLLPRGHRLRALDMGALVSAGLETVEVWTQARVGILPTGSELVTHPAEVGPGKILDSNSAMFAALVAENQGQAQVYPPVKDDVQLLKEALLKAVADNDLVIVNAGSSAGERDFTHDLIAELGEVVVHGIAIKPGKPAILGLVQGRPVIGIPGYPVSSYFVFDLFVKPLLAKWAGETVERLETGAVLSTRVMSSLKHEEKVRVTLGYVENKWIATPLDRGAGVSMSLVRADGILTVPRNSEGIEGGSQVRIELLKPLKDLSRRLVFIGSHDPLLDWMAQEVPLSSSHVGSLGGILALAKGLCHVSPVHLLDEQTGQYNTSQLQRYFGREPMVLVQGMRRLQGLMVATGNPKNIRDFKDLVRPEVGWVNRQRGSGTRLLLDFHLKEKGLSPENIRGYGFEGNTHMAVAVAVASGEADAGLGIYSAALAMGLEFIPLVYENYDFLIRERALEEPRIQAWLTYLQSPAFVDLVEALGGYELERPGSWMPLGGSL